MNAFDRNQVRKAAEAHVRWLKDRLPRVYNGMMENLVVSRIHNANRLGFVMTDIWDNLSNSSPSASDVISPAMDYASTSSTSFFSGLVDSVSNLLSSGGVQTLVNAAQPFINNAIQRQALSTQIQQVKYGLPVTIAGTNQPMETQPFMVSASGATSKLTSYLPYILLGVGGLWALSIFRGKR